MWLLKVNGQWSQLRATQYKINSHQRTPPLLTYPHLIRQPSPLLSQLPCWANATAHSSLWAIRNRDHRVPVQCLELLVSLNVVILPDPSWFASLPCRFPCNSVQESDAPRWQLEVSDAAALKTHDSKRRGSEPGATPPPPRKNPTLRANALGMCEIGSTKSKLYL